MKPRTNGTTPALKGANVEIAVTLQDKEALVRAHEFPKPPTTIEDKYRPVQRSAHFLVTEDMVAKALLCQSVKKAPEPNLHKFRILRIVWAWDTKRITSLVQQAIRLQYHPRAWRQAKGVLMEKPNKRDQTLVKAYES